MATSPESAISALMSAVLRELGDAVPHRDTDAEVAAALNGPASGLCAAVEIELQADPLLAPFLTPEGSPGPFLQFPTNGFRISLAQCARGLVESAFKRQEVFGRERSEEILVPLALEGLEELRNAAQGRPVRSYLGIGLVGVQLSPGLAIDLPWGTVRAPVGGWMNPLELGAWNMTPATAVLEFGYTSDVDVSFDAGGPELFPDAADFQALLQRVGELLPLAFALGSPDAERAAPLQTFQLNLPCFTGSTGGSGFPRPPTMGEPPTISAEAAVEVERWAQVLEASHVDSLKIAAKRTVTAIAERINQADALIDAVTAWESLVGTKQETVFRVTAALTILLEADLSQRKARRKRLQDVYNIRSRVVHGDELDDAKVRDAAEEAIRVALAALRALYQRGEPWLSRTSQERADTLILEG